MQQKSLQHRLLQTMLVSAVPFDAIYRTENLEETVGFLPMIATRLGTSIAACSGSCGWTALLSDKRVVKAVYISHRPLKDCGINAIFADPKFTFRRWQKKK